MLRGEHVMARLYRGKLTPHHLSPDNKRAIETAEAMCALYEEHLGRPRRELEGAVSAAEEELGSRLSDRFETKVKIQIGRSKGKIVVEFGSVDDLQRIIGVMAPEITGRRPEA